MSHIPKPVIFGAIAIILILFIPFLGATTFINLDCGSDFGAGLTTQEATGKSQEQIAQILTTRWLDRHRPFFSCPDSRLSDYSITKVSPEKPDTNGNFTYGLSFDVKKPYIFGENWVSGSGVPEDGGWIRHKYLFISIIKDANGYHIDHLSGGA
ncbi:MAG: hypothetical protein WCO52_00220 [bacterium]